MSLWWRAINHYVLFVGTVAPILACALLGAVAVFDSLQPPALPSVRPLTAKEQLMLIDSVFATRRNAADSIADTKPDCSQARWCQLDNALSILDLVSPPIADWVRGRWQSNHLVFESRERPYVAA